MMYYKKRWRILGIFTIGIVFGFLLFEFSEKDWWSKEENKVVFSKEAGFYEEEFWLELSAAEGEIYYTLDGSRPDRHSIKYDGPIWISDASENENVYSVRTDVSAGFEEEIIKSYGAEIPPGYQVPDYKIDKATVIRAIAYDNKGNKSEINTATYFVNFSQKNGYEGMNVVSVVTEPENLFDYEKGIYVLGKEYDKYTSKYRKQGIWVMSEEDWVSWPANYRNRGKKWEREAICQFFNEDGAIELSQSCGIRIHGGHSRGYTPKSLNLYARKEYDGNKVFQNDFFENGFYPSALTLFQGGGEYRTRVRDYLVASEIKNLNVASMNFEPYVMFLDGEYWGVYWLNDKYNKDYLAYNYGVNADNVIMIKEEQVEEGEEEDIKYYQEMVRICSESDLTITKNYESVCELIDIESYVDYYALLIYLARSGDWPMSNTALWRVKKQENTAYGDGKWRWMVYDLNSTGFEIEPDSIQYVMDNNEMFKNMMTNGDFREKFLNRLEQIMELFEYEKMHSRIEEFRETMVEQVKVHDKRFFGDDSAVIFQQELDEIDLFFRERKIYLTSIMEQYR